MAEYKAELTDEQWAKVEKLLPKRKPNPKGGRKPTSDRDCFEGVLWVLRSGARWKDLPQGVSVEQHVLAPTSRLGRARTLARPLAGLPVETR